MSLPRSITLKEQENVSSCAVKADIDVSNVDVLCWGCQGHQWVYGTCDCSLHLLPTGLFMKLEQIGRIETLAPQERRKKWGRDKPWRQWGTQTVYEMSREQRQSQGSRYRREGPGCILTDLHEDKLEEIQRACGWALQDPLYKTWIRGSQTQGTIL